MTSTTSLGALAEQHLPAEAAARWISLLRPAVRLSAAESGGGVVVGRLGGAPELPAKVEWPEWPGNGPLSFVASVECAALPRRELDIALPADGTLLFFYFDGQFDDGSALVYCADPASMAGARVVYVPAGTLVEPRAAPEGLTPFEQVKLTADVVSTPPQPGHALLCEAKLASGETLDEALDAAGFEDVLIDAISEPWHQIGGHARPVQGGVEFEIAITALGGGEIWSDPRLGAEAARWILLAQIESDGDLMWGDAGALYWLIKPEDLAARRFDKALFTWQCG
ncbi:YwqG family protein [Amycolatopsis sp. H20-H5]|uniref:YwqG family protein n=1 Tax=Amycolatopsis sp. H20-H5 TaxID=3046309 RepID=UPI002DBEFED1|nr:YwqG family protein [Amycolatopsis sp. H20-H5]MEC3981245.1 YwqG family protein [Amycolatopsis sp. H20-H5]